MDTWSYSDVPDKLASELMFTLECLEQLGDRDREYKWLWDIRRKVVKYLASRIVNGKGSVLTEDEMDRIKRYNPILQRIGHQGAIPNSPEIIRVKIEIREKVKRLLSHKDK